MRLDGDGNGHLVAVRLGWSLYWADRVDKGLSEELRKVATPPRSCLDQIPLRRDGFVELREIPAARNIVTFTHRKAEKALSILWLDFGKQAQLARNWYDTLHSMVTPWSELLTETRLVTR